MGGKARPAYRLIFAAAAICLAWLVLLGAAYVVRFRLGAPLGASFAAIGACYLALALAGLGLIGFDETGALAAAGMLVPVAVATVLARLR